MVEPSRFDYVKYDEMSSDIQSAIKREVMEIEKYMDKFIKASPAKTLALAKLEEFYMWTGKAIRDDQIVRKQYFELNEKRVNS